MHARGRTLVGGGSIESDTSLNMAACLRSAVRRTTGAETSPAASFAVSHSGTSKNRSYSSDATKLSANDSTSFPFRFMDVHARAARDPHREQFFEVPIRGFVRTVLSAPQREEEKETGPINVGPKRPRSEELYRQRSGKEEPMSKLETPMTEAFWQRHANGAYLPEYCLVRRSKDIDCGSRLADAVILPDKPHGRGSIREYPTLKDLNVIVVQTKAERMGMYLMGQAVFSAQLVKVHRQAASVRSILLCTRVDNVLLPFLKSYPEVEVWTCDPNNSYDCKPITRPIDSYCGGDEQMFGAKEQVSRRGQSD